MNVDDRRPFTYDQFLEIFLPLAESRSIAPGESALRLLFGHLVLVVQWNRKTNLTRITDLRGMIERHLLDSILPSRWLPRLGAALDVGTGAGFPGLPLKVLNPELDMTLLDASRKKVSFLTVAVASLGISGIRAMHGRWEDLASKKAPAFDLICMRAVRLEEAHVSQLAAELLKPGGCFAWWGGPESEASDAPERMTGRDLSFEGRREYRLTECERSRYLHIWWKAVVPA